MKKLLFSLLLINFTVFAQENNLYPIEDPSFLAYLQENYPQTIVNDSLDVDATGGVDTLDLYNLEIASIDGVQFFNDLTWLNCASNELTSLPELPNELFYLYCSFNNLTSLPELPNGLFFLECSNNQLTSLPQLHNGLAALYCGSNQLTNLPDLPNGGVGGLGIVSCSNNQLTSLPELPNGLFSLSCYANQLTSLPELPNSLFYLLFTDNPIECVTNYLDDFIELTAYNLCPLQGCMEPLACNYNPIANIDDGSCIFGSENVFLNSITDEFVLSSEEPFIYFEQGTDVFSQGTSLFIQGTNLFTQGTSLFFYASYSVIESLVMNLLDFFSYFDDNYELYDCNDCINDINSNGVCDELEINAFGCTNPFACNYDPDATFDDGSCTLAETYYDCNGMCINDSDGDMVCDELEVMGCTDPSACNYNASATDNDESCAFAETYYDCDGVCINDIDGDGECDEFDYDDGVGIDEVSENNPVLIKMIDILGREHQEHNRGLLLFYIYDDGTTKKIMK